VEPDGALLQVSLAGAQFRCAQALEAFVQREGDRVSVLVQPVDMHPRSVAKCDCLYPLTFTLEGAVDATSLSVSTRGDAQSGRDEPQVVAAVELDGQGYAACRPIMATRLDVERMCSLERAQVGCFPPGPIGCGDALSMAKSPEGEVWWFTDTCHPEGWERYSYGAFSSPPTGWEEPCPD
jgi:hypothetical protein